jgi:hypothetical protein
MAWWVSAVVGKGSGVRIVAVEPALSDSMLVCWIRTRGLPDPASWETLQSGLPSALLVELLLENERRFRAEAEVRIEPSLWEDVLTVRLPGVTYRVGSLGELSRLLARLGPFPVRPLGDLTKAAHRLRVRLMVFPLAPAVVRQVEEVLTGEATGEGDRREVSVGLGTLIRYFLGEREGEWNAEAISPGFVPSSLPVVADTVRWGRGPGEEER